ncbi:MAG: hypothetical protein LWX54_09990 [Deltaproteobacteria bacterium]|jgi:hypothetical protein|nr:hypothetical protein [Deltaproteobacteria bacterium]
MLKSEAVGLGGLRDGQYERGLLLEYALTPQPLVLPFLFNPSTIRRTRSVTVKTGGTPGARGGYGFARPDETPRASQGVTVNAESFSFMILLDATDRMNKQDPIATNMGVQPEIDVIRTMLEPKINSQQGLQDISIASGERKAAFAHHEVASVLLFKWGKQVLPVFMTQAQIDTKANLPNLFPYRAEAILTLQVIETDNPVYKLEQQRQQKTARNFVFTAGLPTDILKF